MVFQSPEEVDEDEEDWDEVMSELSDPWMAEPPAPRELACLGRALLCAGPWVGVGGWLFMGGGGGRVFEAHIGTALWCVMLSLNPATSSCPAAEEFVVQEDPEVLAAAAATSAAAAALPIAEVQLVQGLAELEQLQAQAQQGSQPLVLLDVRSQEQFEEGWVCSAFLRILLVPVHSISLPDTRTPDTLQPSVFCMHACMHVVHGPCRGKDSDDLGLGSVAGSTDPCPSPCNLHTHPPTVLTDQTLTFLFMPAGTYLVAGAYPSRSCREPQRRAWRAASL